MTYERMKALAEDLLPRSQSEDKPGYRFDFGGHFDGQDRLFVGSSWGRGLQSHEQERRHIEIAQQILMKHFHTHLHYGGGRYILIVAENRIVL